MSANLVIRSNFPTLLTDILRLAFGNWNVWDGQLWKQCGYKQLSSEKAVEYLMEMQGAQAGAQQQEGSPGVSTMIRQKASTAYYHQYYSQQITISRAAIKDNRQADNLPSYTQQLKMALDQTVNQNAMVPFNNAFNMLSNPGGGDGQPLCSTAHPIATGTLANTFTNGVQLNESALEDAITIIRTWKNAAGLNIKTDPVKLVVPPQQSWAAERILGNPDRPGTADRDINVINRHKWIPGGVISNVYINDPNFWAIITDEMHGLTCFMREPLFFDDQGDINAMICTVKAFLRASWGFTNWRCMFASRGA